VNHLTAEELFALAWPDVPWTEASAADRKMYLDHAHSLTVYNESRVR
jgi:hypothetical protein